MYTAALVTWQFTKTSEHNWQFVFHSWDTWQAYGDSPFRPW